MNKKEIIKQFAEELDIPYEESENIINRFLNKIEKSLKEYGEANFSGFGRFYVAKYKERAGVDPRTGEKVIIPARETVRFKAGKPLRSKF